MERHPHRESHYASIFATLVCAWALWLVVLGLAAPLRSDTHLPGAAVVAADARR